jgi:hypothetical protein
MAIEDVEGKGGAVGYLPSNAFSALNCLKLPQIALREEV